MPLRCEKTREKLTSLNKQLLIERSTKDFYLPSFNKIIKTDFNINKDMNLYNYQVLNKYFLPDSSSACMENKWMYLHTESGYILLLKFT